MADSPAAKSDGPDAALLAMLKKRNRWMHCAVAYKGTNLKVAMDPKKPLKKKDMGDMRKEMGGGIAVQGACLIGNPLKFRFVKGRKAPKLATLVKMVPQQAGKRLKIEIGEELPAVPRNLRELDQQA